MFYKICSYEDGCLEWVDAASGQFKLLNQERLGRALSCRYPSFETISFLPVICLCYVASDSLGHKRSNIKWTLMKCDLRHERLDPWQGFFLTKSRLCLSIQIYNYFDI